MRLHWNTKRHNNSIPSQANGQIERYNKTLAARLRNYVDEHQTNWHEFVQPPTYTYNVKVHKSTVETPLKLILSRHPSNPSVAAKMPTPVDLENADVRQFNSKLYANLFL